jgi:MFS family permease
MRKKLSAVGDGVWSFATAGAGFARNFSQLFVSRALVGIGEATYAPAATALISDKFSKRARARAMGVFQAGMVLGGGIGIVLGGIVGKAWGWRAAFFLVGVPGLLLVVAALAIVERPRRAPDAAVSKRKMLEEILHVLQTRGVFWVYAAGILITFMVGALQFWGVKFVIHYHYGDDAGLTDRVAATFGPVVVISAVAGVILGSVVADVLDKRFPGRGRLMVVGLGPLIGAPFVVLGLFTSSLPLLYISLAIGTSLNAAYAGPVLAALHDVVGDLAHATATGAYFFLVHFLGDAFSPTIVGWIADRTGSLRIGMSVAAGVAVLGGVAALVGLKGAAEAASMHQGEVDGGPRPA